MHISEVLPGLSLIKETNKGNMQLVMNLFLAHLLFFQS